MRLVRHLAISWLANAIVLAVVAGVFDNISFHGWGSLLKASALFGILNTLLKPVLRLVTLPIAVITLGVAWFAVSMLMLAITNWIVDGFTIHGFGTLFWATVAVWAVNLLVDGIGLRALRQKR